jgi:hypothetical protein
MKLGAQIRVEGILPQLRRNEAYDSVNEHWAYKDEPKKPTKRSECYSECQWNHSVVLSGRKPTWSGLYHIQADMAKFLSKYVLTARRI